VQLKGKMWTYIGYRVYSIHYNNWSVPEGLPPWVLFTDHTDMQTRHSGLCDEHIAQKLTNLTQCVCSPPGPAGQTSPWAHRGSLYISFNGLCNLLNVATYAICILALKVNIDLHERTSIAGGPCASPPSANNTPPSGTTRAPIGRLERAIPLDRANV